jgi:hypothetical protein
MLFRNVQLIRWIICQWRQKMAKLKGLLQCITKHLFNPHQWFKKICDGCSPEIKGTVVSLFNGSLRGFT